MDANTFYARTQVKQLITVKLQCVLIYTRKLSKIHCNMSKSLNPNCKMICAIFPHIQKRPPPPRGASAHRNHTKVKLEFRNRQMKIRKIREKPVNVTKQGVCAVSDQQEIK